MKVARTLATADLDVGQRLPELRRSIELKDMVAYAGATWDWHRAHYDQGYATAFGLPGPLVDGQMLGALLAKQLVDWAGPLAFITKLSFRLKAMVFAGEMVTVTGEIVSIDRQGEKPTIKVVQRVLSEDRVVVDPASAEVVLPS